MSPAGAGIRAYRRHTNKPFACATLAVIALACCVLLIPGGSQAHAAPRTPVAAFSPAWTEFQQDCTAGPAPGQGSTPQACVCWESNLAAAAIQPAYAVDALNAAQVGGGAAYTVGENIGSLPIADAMQGCGLNAA